ncbi:MAG TPA: divalent-cation tolerance protein CutA [Kofleriaceae bacterium]|nr:divalent-cation tolerance protein CutA [Kofleriaceae bacterium]
MALALGGETARRHVAHALDRTDGGPAVLLDDQHGARPYTPDGPWYSDDVSDPSFEHALVVLSTFPSSDKAAEVAKILVDEQLAACVSLVPSVRSIYRWQGAVEDATETLALIKTTRERYDALATRIVALHPYEVPEILALPLAGGHAPYLAWLAASTR